MNNLLKFLSLVQLTKDQPLSGYLLAGIKLHETTTLAGHHYTAALAGWLIAAKIKASGGEINERKVVLMLLIHDLSELFGGDIAGPLNRKYPDLRQHKDLIGERTITLLTNYLGAEPGRAFLALWRELEEGETDEAVVVKIIDQMDHQLFLEYHNYKIRCATGDNDYRPLFINDHVFSLTEKIKDQKTKKVLENFLNEFKRNFFNQGYQGMKILMEEKATTTESPTQP